MSEINSSEELRKKRSEHFKRMWQDDEYRQACTEGIRKAVTTDEHRQKASENSKRMWQDEDYRQKMSEIHSSAEHRQKMSEAIKRVWQDDEHRRKMSEIYSSTEHRQKMSEAAKRKWQDEDYRKKTSEGISKAAKLRYQDDAHLNKLREIGKQAMENYEVRQKISESMKRVWQDNEYRQKASETMKQLWQQKEFQEKISKARNASPNIPETLIVMLTPLNVRYTGDRSFCCTLSNGHTANPDFVVEPVEKTKKVIYHHGIYWHRNELHNRGQDLIDQWKQLDFECLIIWEDELQDDLEGVLNKIAEFIGEENWQLTLPI